MQRFASVLRPVLFGLIVVTALGVAVGSVKAQERPEQRKTRTYIPPEQLVSFRENTSFNRFIELLNPVFEREEGKRIVDPEGRTMPIRVPISAMHYFDAFERVLSAHGLTYEETPSVYLIRQAQEEQAAAAPADTTGQPPATVGTREIRINAMLFNLNLTKVRNLGLRWDEILGSTQGGQGGGGAGGGAGGGGAGGGGGTGGQGGQGGQQGSFFIETENLFESVDNILQAPDQIALSRFRRFLNLLEQDDVGRTIANPQVTVQSGQQGEIQIGQDVPIQTTDFAGNTVTEFFSTGIIIDVTPTLLSQPVADTSGAPILDFIHMDVRVEDSNSQPSAAGTIINRNEANTQVLLLNGEATAIGGLISTQKTTTRSGVPLLKDLPGWFFGLRYIFGSETTNTSKQELLIVLQAEVVQPLRARAQEQFDDQLIDQRRRNAQQILRRLGKQYAEEDWFPNPNSEQMSESEEDEPGQ